MLHVTIKSNILLQLKIVGSKNTFSFDHRIAIPDDGVVGQGVAIRHLDIST